MEFQYATQIILKLILILASTRKIEKILLFIRRLVMIIVKLKIEIKYDRCLSRVYFQALLNGAAIFNIPAAVVVFGRKKARTIVDFAMSREMALTCLTY